MAHLYYSEGGVDPVAGALVTVQGDEARHAVRVARLRVGEQILVGDGRGTIVAGPVERVDQSEFSVRVETAEVSDPPAIELWLVQALAKGGRDERAVEQSTEFGAHGVIPWQAERSIARWEGAKAHKGRERWQRITREASKQSLRAFVPEVREAVATRDIASLAEQPGSHVLVLHPRDATPLTQWAREKVSSLLAEPGQRIVFCVGPEGGVSDAELARLEQAGATSVKLGENVLRTSSAGAAAIAVFNTLSGSW